MTTEIAEESSKKRKQHEFKSTKLPASLHKELVLYSAIKGKKMNIILEEALAKYLREDNITMQFIKELKKTGEK